VTRYLCLTAIIAAIGVICPAAMMGAGSAANNSSNLMVGLGFNAVANEYTCNGLNISPRINITGLTAPYAALIMEDPDAPKGTFQLGCLGYPAERFYIYGYP